MVGGVLVLIMLDMCWTTGTDLIMTCIAFRDITKFMPSLHISCIELHVTILLSGRQYPVQALLPADAEWMDPCLGDIA